MNYTKEQLASLYASHGSLRELAKAIGSNPKSLAREMRAHNLDYDKSARKYSIHHDFFSGNDEKTFYWAGFVASSGNILINKGYRIEFNISSQDREHLERMIEVMGANNPVKDYVTKKGSSLNQHVRAVISSKYFIEDLEQRFGLTPRKKFTYTMPNWLLVDDNVRHFIRGWVDGIGGFVFNHNRVTFNTRGTHVMIKQISMILIDKLKLSNTDIEIKSVERNLELLNIYDPQVLKKVFSFLYDDASFFLARKKEDGLMLEVQ